MDFAFKVDGHLRCSNPFYVALPVFIDVLPPLRSLAGRSSSLHFALPELLVVVGVTTGVFIFLFNLV
jgi:hypothetical protein